MILYINNKVDVNYRKLINSSQWNENESHSVVATLCDPRDYTVHGILQARILKGVAFPFSRGSSQPRDRTQVPHIAGGFFTSWATMCVIIKVLVSRLAPQHCGENHWLSQQNQSSACPLGVAELPLAEAASPQASICPCDFQFQVPIWLLLVFIFLSVKILTHVAHLSWWSGTQASQETLEWPFSLWSTLRSCSLSLWILYLSIISICTNVL